MVSSKPTRKSCLTLLPWVMLAVSVLPVAGCRAVTHNQPGVVNSAVGSPSRLEVDFSRACADVKADTVFVVPKAFDDVKGYYLPSPSGGYGYRQGCPFWVVDFFLNSDSHSNPLREPTRFTGIAYDLPSSPSTIQGFPGDPEDCSRFVVDYYVYQRSSLDPTYQASSQWPTRLHTTLSTCNAPKDATSQYVDVMPPEVNAWWVRVAVRVRERNSWQEAAAAATLPPPQ
jgi:hypothetical protein